MEITWHVYIFILIQKECDQWTKMANLLLQELGSVESATPTTSKQDGETKEVFNNWCITVTCNNTSLLGQRREKR